MDLKILEKIRLVLCSIYHLTLVSDLKYSAALLSNRCFRETPSPGVVLDSRIRGKLGQCKVGRNGMVWTQGEYEMKGRARGNV